MTAPAPETESQARVYRFERKFFTGSLHEAEIRHLLRIHPAQFSEIHRVRWVNNIYFDTPLLTNYFENVDGIAERTKLRIRWYGELLGAVERPVLELKIKRGTAGRKVSHPLPGFQMDERLDARALRKLLLAADLSGDLRTRVDGVGPRLLNRYQRRYFLSADGRYRATIDFQMEFIEFTGGECGFRHRVRDHVFRVLELKYAREHDQDADRITSWFPMRMTRSSKYVRGIDLLSGRVGGSS